MENEIEEYKLEEDGVASQPKTNPVKDIVYAIEQSQKVSGGKLVPLTDSKPLQKLLRDRKEENSEAYEWHITQLPADKILSASRVKELSNALYADVCASRAIPDRETWTDEQHREYILNGNESYQHFSTTHPRLVIMLTSSDCTSAKLTHLMRLIEMRRHQESSSQTNDERKQQVAEYFKYHFVRPAAPGEEENAIKTGRGLKATPVPVEEVRRNSSSRVGRV